MMRLGIPVTVRLRLFAAGACTHPEWVTLKGGAWSSAVFPAGFAYVEHPQQGGILIDTGYTARFNRETSRLPFSIYRRLTPAKVTAEEEGVRQLEALGIEADSIRTVILTHFHADHIGGARDYPRARFIYLQEAYDAVRNLNSLAALRAGFLAGLLPEDFAARSQPVSQREALRLPFPSPYAHGYDLLGDGSLFAVELPGHAKGQIGIFLATESDDYFLCADAVWSSRAYRENRPPHPVAGLIMSDRLAYRSTMEKLRELHLQYPGLRIVPSHCGYSLTAWTPAGGEL
ncbi:MBL fold metallo-hydrolase [Gorillibacterium sp. sgz5001074]|uniref:MBL fold metallo-hydrolase n=1 Tax=Gorillibacterium sp. sgz5001074 TaxID=3446695 RepID=UPI003F6755B5